MQDLIFEILFVGVLILLNGYLAGTEIAVVTARKSTIQHMAAEGKKNAKIFLKLKEEPDRFLATIQIGVTLAGAIASAIGGAAAVEIIKPALQKIPLPFIYAFPLTRCFSYSIVFIKSLFPVNLLYIFLCYLKLFLYSSLY